MAFINNVRGRLTQAGQSTVQKAKDLTDLAKLNNTISNSERQISELYGNIGYEVYCAYRNAPLPEVADLFSQITELHQLIENCKAQIKAINAADTCPQCGAKVTKNMAFCSGCGYKLPVAEQPAPDEVCACVHCGAAVSADSVFCSSCGAKIG